MHVLSRPWVALAMNQLGWFACVLGAAAGHVWVGPVVVIVWCCAHVALAERSGREALLVGLVGVWGLGVDASLAKLGHVKFIGSDTIVAPSAPWMVALWLLFATTLRGPMRTLTRRPLLAFSVGALVGPLAYGGGVRLGAAAFGSDPWASRVAIGVAWAFSLPVLGWLEQRTSEAAATDGSETWTTRSLPPFNGGESDEDEGGRGRRAR